MHRGFYRLGVFLTCIWLALIIAIVLYQYFHANPFCQYDARTVWKSTCQGYFWSWVPVGKLATLSPHVARMVLWLILPPIGGWVFGFAINWVIRGFRGRATLQFSQTLGSREEQVMNNWTEGEGEGEAVKVEQQAGESIGGWLYLVAIGMILSLIFNAIHVNQLVEAASNANWDTIWRQGSATMLSIIFEFGMQVYMLVFSIFLAGLFFGRRRNLPKMFVIYVVSIFAMGVIGVFIAASVPNITPQLIGEAIMFPVYVFIFGLIWIPYFLKSKRVKRTFIIENRPNNRLESESR